MCGICGILDLHANIGTAEVLTAMTDSLAARGPDDSGYWRDEQSNIAFGHRRLAVLDLSQDGHQPMHSKSGRYVITYNGEVYNYRILRAELEQFGRCFTGTSDTEVILTAIDQWGVRAAVERFVGIFAFGLWDIQERELHLVRDHVGVKPLYYGWLGGTLLFASELKAFRVHPSFRLSIDRRALSMYLRYNCVPAPYSIYEGVHKVQPGTIVTVSLGPPRRTRVQEYWSPRTVVEEGYTQQFTATDEQTIDLTHQVLKDAVCLQMVADVPVGAFLSGGIDSTLVVALMQAHASRPVRTFSIGFSEGAYNEAQHAKRVAEWLGTEHTELYVTPDDAMAVITQLPHIYDEPFADASQIPTFLVSKLARESVTVSLSGDGGDEVFGGYNRYLWAGTVRQHTKRLPMFMRSAIGAMIRGVPPRAWDALGRHCSILSDQINTGRFGSNMHKFAGLLASRSDFDLYVNLVSQWRQPTKIVLGGNEHPILDALRDSQTLDMPLAAQMMYFDLMTYLPNDILTKVDRASMGVSLEARVPLLDHRVIEHAWHLPMDAKIRHGETKWVLRRILDHYVPRTLIERPKSGFGIPIGQWLRGPLREWANTMLSPDLLVQDGFFNPKPIQRIWKQHLSGAADLEYQLWGVLMFQAWYHDGR